MIKFSDIIIIVVVVIVVGISKFIFFALTTEAIMCRERRLSRCRTATTNQSVTKFYNSFKADVGGTC